MIECIKINKKFGTQTVLSDFSLTVKKGERVVLLGPSGCGKTTLLRLIAGFERPSSGEIRLEGKAVSGQKIFVPPNKRHIGMVFQDLALWPHMSVDKNIRFGLEKSLPSQQQRNEAVIKILDKVKLSGKAQQNPTRLSGGERQRVALARAIIRRPKILLLDEPLANLDFELKIELANLIKDLQSEMENTLIYVTHDRHIAEQMQGRVIYMEQHQ